MNYWLMKTEPEVFSFEDLVAAPDRTAPWDGVRNYQARNMMRDLFRVGDQVLIYHSGIATPSAMGIGQVAGKAYPDPSALSKKSPYFDDQSAKTGESRWLMIDIKAMARFNHPISIEWCRSRKELAEMALLKRGQRLSIQPVTQKEFSVICKAGEPVSL